MFGCPGGGEGTSEAVYDGRLAMEDVVDGFASIQVCDRLSDAERGEADTSI